MEQHRMRKLAAVHSNTKTPSSSSSSSSSSSPSIFQTHKKISKSHDFSATAGAAARKTRLPINPDLAADIHDLSHHMSNLHLNQPSKHRIHHKLQPMSELPSSVEGSKNTKSSQPQRKIAVEIEGFPEFKKSSKRGSGLKANSDAKKVFVSMSKSQDRGLKEAEEGLIKRPSFSLSTSVIGGERRRSFRDYQTELADFFSCAGVKVVAVDMPPFMQMHAVESARKTYDSLEKFTAKTLALTLKKEFDGVYGPAWHCIVGTSFGSFVTHSVGGFLYFSMDHKLYILLFKTTVQRADADDD